MQWNPILLSNYSQIFLATTKLFNNDHAGIESGNVYIKTKRNVDPYIAFLMHPCVVILAGKSVMKISRQYDHAGMHKKKLYKDPRFFFVSMYTLPDSIKSFVVAKKNSTIVYFVFSASLCGRLARKFGNNFLSQVRFHRL